MIRLCHPYRTLALLAFSLLLLPIVSTAQTGWEARYRIPPAVTGNKSEIFVGQQNGTILKYRNDLSNLTSDGTLTPGQELPADVEGVWDLSMPNPQTSPDLIVGLATYKEGSTRHYGILRSTDFGATWELQKPAVMAGFTVLTGRNDFKKLALSTLTWLPDGQHGWLYGVNGLIATADAGKTWTSVYQSSQADSTINRLAFADPLNGVATLGDFHLPPFYKTTDGGISWTRTYSAPFAYRSVDISYVGGQYRALIIDPFQVSRNTYMAFSTDGQKWTLKDKTFYGKISRGQTEMTNMLWDGDNTGYMALRSGEIWRTGDGGLSWASVHDAEDTTSGSIYKVLTGSMNADSAFGQTTVLLGTGDNATLVQFVTGKSTGELQYYQPYPVFTFPASVPAAEFSVTRLNAVAYPNPTRSDAEIDFHVQIPVPVTVELTNELGQRVLSQNLGTMEPGNRSAHLDLTGLPAGAYRYTVVAGDARESGGLTVAR